MNTGNTTGAGVQLKSLTSPHPNRMLWPCHIGTSERDYGGVVVYYSDDFGKTFNVSPTKFQSMDEVIKTSNCKRSPGHPHTTRFPN